MDRLFLALAGLNGFLGVMLGAFGAHGLRNSLASAPDGVRRMEVWETGAHYQLVHAVALAVIAALATRFQSQALPAAGYLFQAGILLFSGSLYVISLTGIRQFGAITPFGGLCFLAGWISVIIAAFKQS
ncbi:MAG TPA: DUF423 domain-containing protein [Polyangiales bacterium]|nr:DUF423 domain-containing protein [Polyangiales bacterium]